MTRGSRPCFFSSLRSRRLAARLSRRFWTRTSSTMPSWSTARQSQCFLPPIIRHQAHLVEMPFVSRTGQPTPDLVGEGLAELAGPLPHGFMTHEDAAGGQHLLHHAQAQGKAEVEPHGLADDLAWKAVASVGGLGCGYHA